MAATPIPRWTYVDDGVLQCDVAMFPTVWWAWSEANVMHRFELVPRKSNAYVPAWDGLHALAAESSLIWDVVALQRDGIFLLGSVAEGSYSAAIGNQQSAPIQQRTERACKVADGLVAMANGAWTSAAANLPGRSPD